VHGSDIARVNRSQLRAFPAVKTAMFTRADTVTMIVHPCTIDESFRTDIEDLVDPRPVRVQLSTPRREPAVAERYRPAGTLRFRPPISGFLRTG
jgi:hypothetical protein